jgi:microcystin-dependent protein
MSQPYVGEIRMFAGNFAPIGWSLCNGSLIAIAENTTLFNLIGTTYGGDGLNTFALPDLRGRVPIHQGGSDVIGASGGVETVTLSVAQIPAHTHRQVATTAAATPAAGPGGNMVASSATTQFYGASPSTPMAGVALDLKGSNQPHDNMAPFLGVSLIISLFGIFPSQA